MRTVYWDFLFPFVAMVDLVCDLLELLLYSWGYGLMR